MRLSTIPILTLIILTGFLRVSAQEINRTVPKEAKDRTAPFLFNDTTRKAGETVYILNCKSCHGEPGKGNYNKQLIPIPKDPASAEYQKNTDGDIFYILGTGRGLMPTFQSTLSEDQRWHVISYIRSFNKDYVQPPVKTAESSELTGKISLELSYDESSKSVIASIRETLKEKISPVSNALIKLYVKRIFGNLPIGQANSDANGKAKIPFPTDIAGDTIGNLTLIAIAGTGGKQFTVDKIEKIGMPVQPVLLLEQNAWWNVRSKAPLWLVISYLCGGIAVGCAIVYVFLQLKKIKDINHINNSGHE